MFAILPCSIDSPTNFIQTNIVGTYTLLQCAYDYWLNLTQVKQKNWRFIQVSTDEVFGDLSYTEAPFTETSPYQPSSPYSASKASADHIVRSWHRTFGLPINITNCSNNYGPYQLPEKLIPLVICNALKGKSIPIYGDGKQIRDWLFVSDHARAIIKIMEQAEAGACYNIGGKKELENIQLVRMICEKLDELAPNKNVSTNGYTRLIKYVSDRPGHDTRYAIDNTKITKELKWTPKESFDAGLEKTICWYLNNQNWCDEI